MEKLGSHWTYFHEIWYLRIFRRSIKKIKASWKSDRHNRYSTWRSVYVYNSILLIFFKFRNVSYKKFFKENQNTHFTFNNFFPRKSRRLWDNVAKYGTAGQTTDDNIIQRMRFACWITKATDIHSEFVIIITFPRQRRLRERAWMLHYSILSVLFSLHIHVTLKHLY